MSQGSQLPASIMELFTTIVYGWTLLTAVITKSSVMDLVGYSSRYSFFASNSKTLKRHSSESIAMSPKFIETQLPDSCHP